MVALTAALGANALERLPGTGKEWYKAGTRDPGSALFYFGAAHEGLLKQVNSEDWCKALKGASEMAEEAVRDQPDLRFERLGRELCPEA